MPPPREGRERLRHGARVPGTARSVPGMSSRIHSQFGTLGERLAAMDAGRTKGRVPAHVWVQRDGEWAPALRTAWARRPEGWWGSVA